jgi:hypothetical protein
MPNAFLELRAKKLTELDINTRETGDTTLDRAFELMDDPEQRAPEIVVPELNYLAERWEEETNDPQAALDLRADLAEYMTRTWDEINSVPQPKRGVHWSMGRNVVLSVCFLQAELETTGQFNIDMGEELGAINKAATRRMSDAQKRKIAVTGGVVETPGERSAEAVEDEETGDEDGTN